VLSPYLHLGILSPRAFYWALADATRGNKKATAPPVSLVGQLLWREFFHYVGRWTPNFDRVRGNALCRQIAWEPNAELLRAWREGRTGYPWIDAIMTQLRLEGWIHHLARHCVACFLTRGDCWVSWEDGAAVFQELLLDADWSLNSANWMWLSCSAFYHQYWKCYSPVAFGKQYAGAEAYIKKYVPALQRYPTKYIFAPHTAPVEMQRAWGCVIGRDYPAPIVDHDVVCPRNKERLKVAFAAAKNE
jgi:cryptochrome